MSEPNVRAEAMNMDAFKVLKTTGVGIIDVGARDGISPMFYPAASLCDVVGFEPDRAEAQRLQDASNGSSRFKSLTYLPWALGETDQERILNLCRSGGVSSFYRPNRAFLDRFPDASRFDIMRTISVPVRSLDSLVKDPAVRMPPSIDFIKIDTQGSELDILRGARQTLHQIMAIEVEVLFGPLYEGQPFFRDVDRFLSEQGFTLFKLKRSEWVRGPYTRHPHLSAGQLVFGDAFYLKNPFEAAGRGMPEDAHQAEALILMALLYDLHDVAWECLAMPGVAALLDADALRRHIERRSRRLDSFGKRLRGARAMYINSDGLRPYAKRWKRSDHMFHSVM